MKPMKLLITAETVGGVWTYTLELLEMLERYPCEVVLATLGAPLTPVQLQAAARLSQVTRIESYEHGDGWDASWAAVDAAGAWLLALADAVEPALVHLNQPVYGALPWRVPVLVASHSCLLARWQAEKKTTPPTGWASYQQQVEAGLRGADWVVAPTQAMLAALQLHDGPLHRTEVIYNGRNPSRFTPSRKEDFIMTSGQVDDEAKNLTLLQGIIDQIEWPIYVAGEALPTERRPLPRQGLCPLGKLTPAAVAHWLSQAAIYAAPAHYEPLGDAILDAAFSGCALVLSDLPNLRELWAEAAIFLPPDDRTAWAHTLNALCQHPERRRTLGRAAQLRAQQYTATTMGAAYWQRYQALTTPTPMLLPQALMCLPFTPTGLVEAVH